MTIIHLSHLLTYGKNILLFMRHHNSVSNVIIILPMKKQKLL